MSVAHDLAFNWSGRWVLMKGDQWKLVVVRSDPLYAFQGGINRFKLKFAVGAGALVKCTGNGTVHVERGFVRVDTKVEGDVVR